jgi:hypothetical protein
MRCQIFSLCRISLLVLLHVKIFRRYEDTGAFCWKCINIHSNELIPTRCSSLLQVYCLSFKYSSTCFGHPLAHHQEPINCSSSGLWFTVGTWWYQCCWSWLVHWTDHDQQHWYHHVPTVNQRLLLQLIGYWWWARGCPKHVELYLNDKQ